MASKQGRRARFDKAILEEVGRIYHERLMSMADLKAKYGVHDSTVYKAVKMHRDRYGLEPSEDRAPRSSGGKHVPVKTVRHDEVTGFEFNNAMQRISQLEQELAITMDENRTLQKILMVVGRTL